jgi:integrase
MTEIIEQNATPETAKRDINGSARPRLLDQVRERIRVLHYSMSTEKTYIHWILAFIRFHGRRHPAKMGAAEVESYLSHLATAREVAAGTQNQAMHAILFLYKQVLGVDLPWLDGITRAKPSKRLPTVLTQAETHALLAQINGPPGLVIRLLYNTGMRLMEELRLRVKDIDFAGRAIIVRAGKGDKDRVVPLPECLIGPLQARLDERRQLPLVAIIPKWRRLLYRLHMPISRRALFQRCGIRPGRACP